MESRKATNMDKENQTESQTETELVVETLVEEVSIDGMCGVY
jgi:mycofactocin precursor peptide MftA